MTEMIKVRLAEAPLVQAVFVGFALLILLRLVDQVIGVLVLFVIALVVAAAIAPIVRAIHEPRLPPKGWRVPVGVAVLVVFLLTGLLAFLTAYIVGGLLVGELVSLASLLPPSASALVGRVDQLAQPAHVPPALLPSPDQIGQQVQVIAGSAFTLARAFVTGIVQFVIQLVIVLTLAAFLVIEADELTRFWVQLFPRRHQAKAYAVSDRIGRELGSWVLAQLAMSSVVGVVAGVAAWLLDIPFPVLVGALSALFQLIPVFSTMTMTIPVFFLGLSQSPERAVIDTIVFFILAQIDGSVIWPVIAGRVVHLSPVVVAVAIPLGAALYGPTGAILSVPLAVAIRVVVDDVALPWLHRQEGEDR
jgi:predicted PurR-regulated permease PerM